MIKLIDKKYIPLYIISFILIVFSNITIDPVLLPRFVTLSLFLLFFTLYLIFTGKLSVQINLFFIFFIVYILYSAIAVTYSINTTDAIFELSKLILFLSVIFTFIVFYNNSSRLILNFTRVISLISLIIVFIGIYQILSIENKLELSHQVMYQISSVFANKNIFSEVLLLLFPFSVYNFIYEKKIFRAIALMNIVLILFFIIILLSRASWVAFLISMFLTFLFLLVFTKKTFTFLIKKTLNKKITWILFIFISVIIIFSVSYYSKKDTFETFEKQVTTFTDFKNIKQEDRIQLWKKTIFLIKKKPVFGKGLASWKTEILKYGNQNLHSEDNTTFYQRPHNDYLWILAEQGIIGLILYISLFITLFFYSITIIKNTDNEQIKVFFILNIWVLFSFLIISIFSFPKERIEHNILLSLITALTIIYYNKLINKKLFLLNNKLVKRILLLLLPVILFSFFIGTIRINGEFYLKKAFDSRASNSYQITIENIDKANSVFYKSDPFSTPIIWYKGEANFHLNNINAAFSNFKTAYNENPYHIHVLNNLASCYEIKQNHSAAIEYYKKAIKIAPNFDESLLNISAVYYNVEEIDSAFYYFNKVDTSSLNTKYHQFMYPILKMKISKIHENVKNEAQRNVFIRIQNNESWLKEIYIKSKRNHIDFKEQLLLDIDFILEQDSLETLSN